MSSVEDLFPDGEPWYIAVAAEVMYGAAASYLFGMPLFFVAAALHFPVVPPFAVPLLPGFARALYGLAAWRRRARPGDHPTWASASHVTGEEIFRATLLWFAAILLASPPLVGEMISIVGFGVVMGVTWLFSVGMMVVLTRRRLRQKASSASRWTVAAARRSAVLALAGAVLFAGWVRLTASDRFAVTVVDVLLVLGIIGAHVWIGSKLARAWQT